VGHDGFALFHNLFDLSVVAALRARGGLALDSAVTR